MTARRRRSPGPGSLSLGSRPSPASSPSPVRPWAPPSVAPDDAGTRHLGRLVRASVYACAALCPGAQFEFPSPGGFSPARVPADTRVCVARDSARGGSLLPDPRKVGVWCWGSCPGKAEGSARAGCGVQVAPAGRRSRS